MFHYLRASNQKYFGYHSFRPLQLQVVTACLEGRDSFVCMATGAGKSLCYQFPPLVASKVGEL